MYNISNERTRNCNLDKVLTKWKKFVHLFSIYIVKGINKQQLKNIYMLKWKEINQSFNIVVTCQFKVNGTFKQ